MSSPFTATSSTVLKSVADRRAALLAGAAILSLVAVSSPARAQTYNQTIENSGSVDLPAGYASLNQFNYDLCGCNLSVLLTDPGTTVTGQLRVTGKGRFENLASFKSVGRSVAVTSVSQATGLGQLSFINRGNLIAQGDFSTEAAVAGDYLTRFENHGLIKASGYDMAVYADISWGDDYEDSYFLNTGSIILENGGGQNTALYIADAYFAENAGTISAIGSGAVGVVSNAVTFRNATSGLIEGGKTGVLLSGRLINSGQVLGGTNGVESNSQAVIINEAGAVIQGASEGASSVRSIGEGANGTVIANRGRLVGDVDLGYVSDPALSYNRRDFYMADTGGVLEGNLKLGEGDDTYIVDLSSSGSPFTGVTGTVDAGTGYDTLRFRADTSASISIADPSKIGGGFEAVGYEAVGVGTMLNLNGSSPITSTLSLTGNGSFDLAADMVVARSALRIGYDSSAALLSGEIDSFGQPLDRQRTNVISRGTIEVTGSAAGSLGAIEVGSANFENAGIIRLTGEDGYAGSKVAVYAENAAGNIVNSGSIELGVVGSAGVSGTAQLFATTTVINSGLISQATGLTGGSTTGVEYVSTLDNRGTIRVGGGAVLLNYQSDLVLNSGTIESTGFDAIRAVSSAAGYLIDNQATGIITGGGTGSSVRAISSAAGSGAAGVRNAGTINGDILFSGAGDVFVAAGGAVNGSVMMGNGDDLVLTIGGTTGISGALEAGDGVDAYGRLVSASGEVTLEKPGNFEAYAVAVEGTGTTAVLKSATTLSERVRIYGEGAIVNNASITLTNDTGATDGAIELGSATYGQYSYALLNRDSFSFTNNAVIDSVDYGVTGRIGGDFTNTGTITGLRGGVQVKSLAASGGTAMFTNSATGLIEARDLNGVGVSVDFEAPDQAASARFENAGIIKGSAFVLSDAQLSVINSGTIDAVNRGIALGLSAENSASRVNIDVTNSGSILAPDAASTGVVLRSFVDPSFRITAIDLNCDPVTGEPIPFTAARLTNTGLIEANGAGTLDTTQTPAVARFSVAAAFIQEKSYLGAELTNAASGVIEAKGANSAAIIVQGGTFRLVNDGVITGAANGASFAAGTDVGFQGASSGFALPGNQLASAIQTINSVDSLYNNGTITGSIDLGAGNDTLENYGTITGNIFLGDGADRYVHALTATTNFVSGDSGVDTLVVDANGASKVDFSNFRNFEVLEQRGTGLISLKGTYDGNTLTIAGANVRIESGDSFGADDVDFFAGTAATETLLVAGTLAGTANLGAGDDTVTVASGGTVMMSLLMSEGADTVINAGTVQGHVDLGAGNDRYVAAGGSVGGSTIGGVLTTIEGGEGLDTLAISLAGDQTGGVPLVSNFETLEVSGAGTLSYILDQSWQTIALAGTNLVLKPGGNFAVGQILGSDAAEQLTVTAPLTTGVSLGGGDDRLSLTLSGGLSGALDGGAGLDTLDLTLTGATTLSAGAAGFEAVTVTGTSPLTIAGTFGSTGQTLDFDGRANHLIVAGTLASDTRMGGGDDRLTLGDSSVLAGLVSGGEGTDTVAIDLTRNVAMSTAQLTSFEVLSATGEQTLSLAGASLFQTVVLNGGGLSLDPNASLTASTITFDGANNVLSLGSGSSIVGRIDAGAGIDTLALTQNAGDTRNLSSLDTSNFEALAVRGTGTINIDRSDAFSAGMTLAGGTINVAAGVTLGALLTGSDASETLSIAGSFNGDVDLGKGNNDASISGNLTGDLTVGDDADTVAIAGSIDGNLNLGGGNDRLVLASIAGSGTRVGGDGTDVLEFRTGGTALSPTVFSSLGYTGFENLVNVEGTLALTGAQSYNTVSVSGGRLIGLAGSALSSVNAITVGQGATFGSAGTVNANIAVAGTLSPGASPGTMMVNGNVSMLSGSTLLLEFAPAGRDLLNISGALNIAEGATIDLTGALASMPGGAIDLVVANDGIAGSFTTINKSPNIFGFVAQRGNRIQLLGEFQNDESFAQNAQASINFVNSVLRSGQGVQAFTNALPRLVDAQGRSNETAFGQLTPEAYASAGQIGLHNALLVTDAARLAATATRGSKAGPFAFGQVLGNWGNLQPQGEVTLGRGDVESFGAMSGVGYDFGNGTRIGAFLGHVDSQQDLSGLDASTQADGLVVGLLAQTQVGGFGFSSLVAYNGANAETNRTLVASQSTANSSYDISTVMADASIDYSLDLAGVTVSPKLGLTYVRTKRDGTVESSGDFALAVDEGTTDNLYADAGLSVSTRAMLGSMGFAPYGELRVRHRIEGDRMLATGRFAGVGGGDLTVSGSQYDKTVARVSTGISVDVTSKVRLNAGYGLEVGESRLHTVTGGFSLRF